MKGTGRLYRRGEVWWVDYSFRGTRYRESSGSERKADAVKLLRKRMEEMGKGRLVGPDEERLMFSDLEAMILTDYQVNQRRSLKRLKSALASLRGFFGRSRALDITTDRVQAYVLRRQEDGRSNSTIRIEVNALRRAFNLAKMAGRISTVPHIPSPRANTVREGFLSAGEVAAVLEELPSHIRPIVRFAYLTGWRKQEILLLRWAQVDFNDGVVRLAPGTTKSGSGRELPFRTLPALESLLEDQFTMTRALNRQRDEIIPWVFHRNGEQIRSIRTAWDNACRRAGLPGTWFHDLRRSAVRNLERAGVPRSVAMKVTGHRTESVYTRYAIADRTSMEEGLKKLAQLESVGNEPGRTVVALRQVGSA